jgi:hypothetical protein
VEVHDVGDFPGVQRSMSSRIGLESGCGNPVVTTSTGTANARPTTEATAVVNLQRLLHSCLPSQLRAVGHLLPGGMNALRGRKVPACLHAKRDPIARKPEHAACPAEMPKLRRTREFPVPVHIEPVKKLCGYRHRQTPHNSHSAAELAVAGEPYANDPATQRDHVAPINNLPPPRQGGQQPHQTEPTIAPTHHLHAALYIRAQLPIRCRTSAPA